MKQSVQARLTTAQIEAIRRKRQQGWTPRQIEEDTGVDHVTVWLHTRNIRPNKEERQGDAGHNGQGTMIPPPAPVPAPAIYSYGPSQMSPVAYQYTSQANLSQPTPVQTPLQTLSPRDKPRIVEYVIEREVDRKEPKGWYDRLWDEENRYLVHRAKMAIRERRLAEANQRLAKANDELRQVESRTRAEHQGPDNESSIRASDIIAFLTRLAAERVRNGMDAAEAARRFGEDIDMCILWAFANRRSPEN